MLRAPPPKKPEIPNNLAEGIWDDFTRYRGIDTCIYIYMYIYSYVCIIINVWICKSVDIDVDVNANMYKYKCRDTDIYIIYIERDEYIDAPACIEF